MSPGAAAGASGSERTYLNETFAELCRIESPSGAERACARMVQGELAALGISSHEDGAGAEAGSDCGNVLARIDPAGALPEAPWVLLCAHLDTVPLLAPVEPVLEEGVWENANEAILGADNKAAIAVLLALARRLRAGGEPVGVELLFTVGEERSLAGASAFDAGVLRSSHGFVFDHASPIGEIVVASPSHFLIEATFRGKAAHAGIRPEDGRSAIVAAARAIAAMRLGRIDEQTTANVGKIAGGSAINVVAERCTVSAEVRSIEDASAEAHAAELVDALQEAANRPGCDCDLDVSVRRTFAGYRLARDSAPLRAAKAALSACGYEPREIASGGGSDANALIVKGLQTVNVANGTERNHEPGERVSESALAQMLDVAHALVREAAPARETAR